MEIYSEGLNSGKLDALQRAQAAEKPSILHFNWESVSFH